MKYRIAALAGLFALILGAQPRIGQTNIAVPVPPDPHELVTGPVQTAAEDHGAALEILQRALQNSRLQNASMGPFRIDVTFTPGQGGPGQFTETWLSPQAWRWSANFGGSTVIRSATSQGAYANSDDAVPMSIHMLRNAIFSSMYGNIAMGTQLRTAAAIWNGKPATCMMTSGVVGAAKISGRLWEELEYCFDNASGLLVSSSFAPGVFTVYSYAQNQHLRGHTLADHFTMYEGGKQVLDGALQLSDATGTDPNSLAPTPGMVLRGAVLDAPIRQPMPMPAPAGVTKVLPVIVHANVFNGEVVQAEICAASDPLVAAAALSAVQQMHHGSAGAQQQIYFTVKFVPPSN
jgi:hypothetical protein